MQPRRLRKINARDQERGLSAGNGPAPLAAPRPIQALRPAVGLVLVLQAPPAPAVKSLPGPVKGPVQALFSVAAESKKAATAAEILKKLGKNAEKLGGAAYDGEKKPGLKETHEEEIFTLPESDLISEIGVSPY